MMTPYQKEYKIKNRLKLLQQHREYNQEHAEEIRTKNRIYALTHKIERRVYNRKYKSSPEYLLKRKKWDRKYYKKTISDESTKKQRAIRNRKNALNYHYRHRDTILQINRERYWLHREKKLFYKKEWRKNNPRSGFNGNIELEIAMNNVRRRDNNTCQWYGCGLTYRDAPIHVHHIFPKSEYPELQLIEQYMICYCANHHGLWHRYRGDSCHRIIFPSGNQANIDQLEYHL